MKWRDMPLPSPRQKTSCSAVKYDHAGKFSGQRRPDRIVCKRHRGAPHLGGDAVSIGLRILHPQPQGKDKIRAIGAVFFEPRFFDVALTRGW